MSDGRLNGTRGFIEPCYYTATYGPVEWNPLESDSDVFKLIVLLGMSVECDDYSNTITVYSRGGVSYVDASLDDCCKFSATRRAICECVVLEYMRSNEIDL